MAPRVRLIVGVISVLAIAGGCDSDTNKPPPMEHHSGQSPDGSNWSIDQVKLDDTPAPVQATLHEVLGDHQLRNLHRETVDTTNTYEAEYDDGGVDHAVLVSETGEIVATSHDVDQQTLPKPVLKSLWDRFPKGQIREVQSVKAGSREYYVAQVAEAGAVHKLRVTPSGEAEEVASWLDAPAKK